MNQKKVLGRGLGALIPQRQEQPAAPTEARATQGLAEILISQIQPNPYQPRKTFNEASIEDLARSVREHGIVQPLVVTRAGDKYKLIAGERRFRAAQKAGLTTVPALIKEMMQEGDALQIALIENIQREDLNPIEEALAYHQLHDEFQLTQEEISKRVGKERSTVANFLRLLKLPDPVKKLLASGQLSMGHARALLALESPKKQEQLADRVVRKNLNVRQTEGLASESSPKAAEKKEKEKDVFTRDAEDKLQRTLRTKVEIDRRRRGGVIHIRYGSEEELIRVVDELMGRRR
ncbi:MAG: ParB family transcriptional regulator, chromosome partitioning protein [Thermoanaerobaculia bacterium]|jgi:ParB family chromosome partitioning protein|nr:ParB family transcriptional regulator, chromosome partitioning protein [Thermoanaerobaculia bacterium]